MPVRVISFNEVIMTLLTTGAIAIFVALHIRKIKVTIKIKVARH